MKKSMSGEAGRGVHALVVEMAEGRVLAVAHEVIAEERADLLRLRNRLAHRRREFEQGARGKRVVELPVGDLRGLGGGVVDEVLERGLRERRLRGYGLAEVESALLAPGGPGAVLVAARAPAVVLVPLARAAAGEDVAADAVAPALLGVGDEVEHPLLRPRAPFGIAGGVRDIGEGVEPEPVRGPVRRVEVDHHHEARVRARLHEVARLRVERRPVVALEVLPDGRVLAVRRAAAVDRVRREEAPIRDAHGAELAGALQLLVEAAVRDPELLPALRVEAHGGGTRRRKTCCHRHQNEMYSHHLNPFTLFETYFSRFARERQFLRVLRARTVLPSLEDINESTTRSHP